MMRLLKLVLLLAGFGQSGAIAAPIEVQCPASLRPEVIQLAVVPEGWQFFAAAPIYLHGAAPMSTVPDKLGHLIEDGELKRKGERILVYSLEGPFPDGKWIQCAYGEHHQLTLSRRLPDHVKQCSVAYRQGEKAGERRVRIMCE